MNKIPARITKIIAHNACAMIQMECELGLLCSVVINEGEFSIHDNVLATFKENEVLILNAHSPFPFGEINTFRAALHSQTCDSIFTRLKLEPHIIESKIQNITSHNPKSQNIESSARHLNIYALVPSSKPLVDSQCLWHIPPVHIVLERIG